MGRPTCVEPRHPVNERGCRGHPWWPAWAVAVTGNVGPDTCPGWHGGTVPAPGWDVGALPALHDGRAPADGVPLGAAVHAPRAGAADRRRVPVDPRRVGRLEPGRHPRGARATRRAASGPERGRPRGYSGDRDPARLRAGGGRPGHPERRCRLVQRGGAGRPERARRSGSRNSPGGGVGLTLQDAAGQAVRLFGLPTDDPAITVWGARVTPGTYRVQVEQPVLSTAFTFDTSGSMATYVPNVREALRLFVRGIDPSRRGDQAVPLRRATADPGLGQRPLPAGAAGVNLGRGRTIECRRRDHGSRPPSSSPSVTARGRCSCSRTRRRPPTTRTPPSGSSSPLPGLSIFAIHVGGSGHPDLTTQLMQDWAMSSGGPLPVRGRPVGHRPGVRTDDHVAPPAGGLHHVLGGDQQRPAARGCPDRDAAGPERPACPAAAGQGRGGRARPGHVGQHEQAAGHLESHRRRQGRPDAARERDAAPRASRSPFGHSPARGSRAAPSS